MPETSELERLLIEGRTAYESGEYKRAQAALTKALAGGAAAYADVHHMLGVIHHTSGRFSKARAAFETALEINPTYTEAALNLSITYNDLGRYAEAKELFKRFRPEAGERIDAFTRGKIANLHAAVGEAYLSAGLAREASDEYRRALGLCPDFFDIRMSLSRALTEMGAVAEAIAELRRILDQRPEVLAAYLHLGLLLNQAGDKDGAKSAFVEVLVREPNHERATAYLRMLEVEDRSE